MSGKEWAHYSKNFLLCEDNKLFMNTSFFDCCLACIFLKTDFGKLLNPPRGVMTFDDQQVAVLTHRWRRSRSHFSFKTLKVQRNLLEHVPPKQRLIEDHRRFDNVKSHMLVTWPHDMSCERLELILYCTQCFSLKVSKSNKGPSFSWSKYINLVMLAKISSWLLTTHLPTHWPRQKDPNTCTQTAGLTCWAALAGCAPVWLQMVTAGHWWSQGTWKFWSGCI